ncbi:MAG: response regulator [Rhodospirillaceae bacterium]
MKQVLVVDDDPHILDVICFALEKAGYAPERAEDGHQALERFARKQPALIILDVGLPELDGLEVCRQIRRSSDVPILFLSARADEIDRILGLEIGGDDYVTKPFSPRELVTRVGVILKRQRGAWTTEEPSDETIHGALTVNKAEFSVTLQGQPVELTKLEFNILITLLARPRMVFSRAQILDLAYADNMHVSDRTIDSHIRNLRAKFAALGGTDVIETVHGLGFRMGTCQSRPLP